MKFSLSKLLNSLLVLVLFTLVYYKLDWIMSQFELSLRESGKALMLKIIHSLIWLIGAYFVNQIINFLFWRKYHATTKKSQAPKLFKEILVIFVYLIVISVIIGYVFKKPLTGLWATSSVTALVLGFALRNIILDLFSGIAVHVEQPFVVGDWILVDQNFSNEPITGIVLDINWRSTYLKTEENSLVIIPNSLITTQAVITNFSKGSLPSRYEVNFTLDYSVPSQRAIRVLMAGAMEAIMHEGFVRENEPQVLIDQTNELGIVYSLRYWILPWHKLSPSWAKSIIQSKVLEHLDAAGLTLAYPKEDIYYSSMPVRQLGSENEADRIKLLSKIDLFTMLTPDEIENLSNRLLRREFRKDTDIVRVNETGDSMFILLEGLLNVTIVNSNGLAVKVAQISPGNYFGEMSLLTGETRSATVTAASDSIVFEITRESFNEILSLRVNIIDRISENIAARKSSNEKLLSGTTEDPRKSQLDYKLKLINSIKAVFKIK
jgi:small-conductance mechanosensitive channel/CRP-like cAMP-binding protein